jgi:hypothetical protein
MRVFAYLDPGSGSVMLQALLGGVATVLVSIKMFGRRVFRTLMFWKKFDDDEETKPASESSTTATTQRETEKEPV